MVLHGIDIRRDHVADFCRRNSIRKLALYGSILRDDFTPESDIDVLVEFKPEARVGFFKLHSIEQDLSAMMGERKVEVNTPNSLSPYFRDEVLADAEVLYVET
jgi:predicted nucleotidyltransferase